MSRGWLALLLVAALASACTPARAVPTETAAPTSTPEPADPTRAPVPPSPTATPPGRQPYILETGFCMPSVSRVSTKDPKTLDRCSMDTRQEVRIGPFERVTLTLDNFGGRVKVYCALFSMDGSLLMTYLDDTGSGRVVCYPP